MTRPTRNGPSLHLYVRSQISRAERREAGALSTSKARIQASNRIVPWGNVEVVRDELSLSLGSIRVKFLLTQFNLDSEHPVCQVLVELSR
jgi:hypothetical protein